MWDFTFAPPQRKKKHQQNKEENENKQKFMFIQRVYSDVRKFVIVVQKSNVAHKQYLNSSVSSNTVCINEFETTRDERGSKRVVCNASNRSLRFVLGFFYQSERDTKI